MEFIDKNFRAVQFDNGEVFQGAYCSASPSVTYYTADGSSATDPFAGKTNKYAESKVVSVFAEDVVHVAWGSSAPTADTQDCPVPSGVKTFFVVAKDYPYMSIIADSAVAVFVEEIY